MAKRVQHSGQRAHPRSDGPAPAGDCLIALARRVTEATGEPVVGGVAVLLHGGGRHTRDTKVYSRDFWKTHEKLEAAGMYWNKDRREHVVEGVRIRLVNDAMLGGEPSRISTMQGVKVIGLADLVRSKLRSGLESMARSKDITHVIDLIERVPLDRTFAARLPTRLRKPFKTLVDQVHEPRRSPMPAARYWKRYAS
jgi:hypothetical protein